MVRIRALHAKMCGFDETLNNYMGSLIRITVPPSFGQETAMEPPCSVTTLWVIDKPRAGSFYFCGVEWIKNIFYVFRRYTFTAVFKIHDEIF